MLLSPETAALAMVSPPKFGPPDEVSIASQEYASINEKGEGEKELVTHVSLSHGNDKQKENAKIEEGQHVEEISSSPSQLEKSTFIRSTSPLEENDGESLEMR